MKRRCASIALCLILSFLCCSCGLLRSDKEYVCDHDTVESVEIVKIGEYSKEKNRYDYEVLSIVSDHPSFVQRLNNIECSEVFREPTVFETGEVIIKIEYFDGDYDLLGSNAQLFERSGEKSGGYFSFDQKQFDALISDYYAGGNT
ncbi:MAG: hypothetical protein IJZ37_02185 [Clostridia bacterium]|nr:hypothetical protein [Clostridia bacterium]